MKTQDIKGVLFEKLDELNSGQIGRGNSTNEKTSGADETWRDDIGHLCVSRKTETTTLVSEALRRLERDTYGTCANCDGPISPKRLAAIPWAKYCIACQESRDRSATHMRLDDAA